MEDFPFQDDEITISSTNKVEGYYDYKQGLISRFIATPAGRQKLAASMAQPLRTRIDYSGMSRRALVVDPLLQDVLPTYDRDIDVTSCLSSFFFRRRSNCFIF
jgi:hypothetical protein